MVSLVPRPAALTVHEGRFELAGCRLHAPPAVADLAREVLGDLPDAAGPGAGTVSLRLAAEPGLGPEGYRLRVTAEQVDAAAPTGNGLRWAVQTLRQLLTGRALPCVEIEDRPRYGWRGSLLDVARWCHPLPFLFRYVDLLALHKLNTLHLHLTDDQGWRFEVRRYPLLTEVGGYRRESPAGHARERRFDATPHGGWYGQDDLRALVRYAAARGVRVLPEIDLPGHMQAAIAAYPVLGNDPARRLEVRTAWGISRHVLNVAGSTVDFVGHVLDELVDVFPFEYVHLGGDEVPTREWAASPAARDRAAGLRLSSVGGLLGWWMARGAALLAERRRRMAAWDEVLDHDPPPGTTIFAWRHADRVAAARAAGLPVVAVPQAYTYLDWAETDAPGEPLAIRAALPLDTVYGYEPGDVLGTQGQLWSEYLPTTELVEWRAFPRLAALAEVAWSPAPRDPADFHRRLPAHLARLDALDVHYRRSGQ